MTTDSQRAQFEKWHIDYCSRHPELQSLHGFGDDKKAWAAWRAALSQAQQGEKCAHCGGDILTGCSSCGESAFYTSPPQQQSAPAQGAAADNKPLPNWCRTCGKLWKSPDAVFCRDSIHKRNTTNTTTPPAPAGDAFRYVNVVGRGYEGYINLFFDGEIIALVSPPTATKIKSAIKPLEQAP